jgi:mannose-6-phosphate isomerase-like protein (cupin superfamily)
MLVRKEDRKEKRLSENATVWEYHHHFPSKAIGFAVSKLNNRVPDSGYMRNKVCAELYYVLSGSATVFVEGEKFEIGEGDVLLIEPGKKFYVEANDLHVAIPTAPAFYAEQWEHVEK